MIDKPCTARNGGNRGWLRPGDPLAEPAVPR
jgi:hypothetical protein